MIKNIKQTRPATWLAGGAIALSANAADAALVQVGISDGVRNFSANTSYSFGNAVGLSATGFANLFTMPSATTSGVAVRKVGTVRVGFSNIGYDYYLYRTGLDSYVSPDLAVAGSDTGRTTDDLLGLRAISLALTAGGFVDGWVVVTNDNARFGNAGVTHFIYNDADLGDRSGSSDGDATITGFNNSDYDTVLTVAAAAVPEPSSIGLLALGAAGVMLRRNRKSIAA